MYNNAGEGSATQAIQRAAPLTKTKTEPDRADKKKSFEIRLNCWILAWSLDTQLHQPASGRAVGSRRRTR